jgi:hypothetical protein
MPALPDQYVKARAADGTTFAAKCATHVDVEGRFTVAVPEELEALALELLGGRSTKTYAWPELKNVGIAESHGKFRATGRDLKAVTKALDKLAEIHLTVEEKTERVIVYRASLQASFWLRPDGTMTGNGAGESGGRWWEPKTRQAPIHASEKASQVSVGFVAKAFDRTTYTRPTGDTTTWDEVDHDDDDKSAARLNKFTTIRIANPAAEIYDRMAYTPEAADYFYKLMLAICSMAKSLDEFTADKARLTAAIASGTQLLLK